MMHAQGERLLCGVLCDMIHHRDVCVDKVALVTTEKLAHSRFGTVAAYDASASCLRAVLEFNADWAR